MKFGFYRFTCYCCLLNACITNVFFSKNNISKNNIKNIDVTQKITSIKGVDDSVIISKKQQDEDFPVDKAIALAYANNPQIKAAIASKLAADEQLAQAFSEFYPTITAKFSTGIEEERSQENEHKKTKTYKHSAGVDFVLNLYGDGTLSKLDKAHLMLISERYNYIKTEQDILLRTVSAFMDVWSAAEQVKIYEKMKKNFKECVDFSSAHLKVGLGKTQDLASFQASYSDAEYKLTNAKAALKSAKALLAQYIGKKPKGVVVIPSSVVDIPNDISLLKEKAEKLNAGLLAEKYKADAIKYDIDIKFSDLPPYLNLEGGLTRELKGKNRTTTDSSVTFENHTKDDTYNIGLVMRIPVWKNSTSGGSNPYSSIRKAKVEAEAAKFNVINVRNALLSDVSKAWYTFVASKAQIDQSIAAVKSAEISVDGYREQERLGAASATDVVYNENKLLEARLQYVEARRKYIVSAYQIKSILGEIAPDFDKYSIDRHDIVSNENFVKYAPLSIKAAKIK